MNAQVQLPNQILTNEAVSASEYFTARLRELLALDGVTDYAVTSAWTEWNENNGNIEVFAIWDRIAQEAKRFYYTENFKDVPPSHHVKRDATEAERNLALDWVEANRKFINFTKAVGHTFKVGGSRKVKKGTEVVFLQYDQGGFNPRFRNYDPAKVLVEEVSTGERHWISPNCLKEWVKGIREF